MKPARFSYFRPTSLEEALELLSRHGPDARLIAGGQSLVPMMNLRIARPAVLIDLARVGGLAGIAADDTSIRIGAMTRQCELLTNADVRRQTPMLARAAAFIGHFQTRSRGTVGGSLANADPSAELSLVAVTLGATMTLRSLRGARRVAARDFFVDALTTAAAEDEILTEVEFPAQSSGTSFAFHEISRRHGDFAIASCAAARSSAGQHVLIGLGGIGTVPLVCHELGSAVVANSFETSAFKDIMARELAGIEPISDLNGSAAYRRRLAARLAETCLREVIGHA